MRKDAAFFSTNSITIFNDDFLTTKSVKRNSVDLTITSPPYSVDVKYGQYKDDIPYSQYLTFTKNWLGKCLSLTKPDGRLCLNIPLDKNKGGQQSVYADIENIAREIGWKYHTTIIWNEQNISRRTAWGSWLSASAPFIIAPVEMILVMYKGSWKKTSGSGKSDISRGDFLDWTNGFWEFENSNEVESNPVWSFNGESKKKTGHPAPFPLELPKRCIKLFSYVGDTILDPFLGSGTTLVASHQADRIGIGVEIDEKYCKLAKIRLEKQVVPFERFDDTLTATPNTN